MSSGFIQFRSLAAGAALLAACSAHPAHAQGFGVRLAAGGSVQDAGQAVLAAGVGIPLGSFARLVPDVAYGTGSRHTTLTASATLLLRPFGRSPGGPYLGGGVGMYRESSGASGTPFTRTAPAWVAVAGVQARGRGAAPFVEARVMGGRYEADEFVRATGFVVPRVVAGITFQRRSR